MGLSIDRQVNHLAPFYLTELLLPNLRKAYKDTGDPSRVVLVASGAHRWANANGKGAVRCHFFTSSLLHFFGFYLCTTLLYKSIETVWYIYIYLF